MTEYFGHDDAWRQFSSARTAGKLHHGWILAGVRGMGKAGFALRAAASLVDPDNRYASMISSGSHPDILTVKRLTKEQAKDDDDAVESAELKRSITINQIRALIRTLNYRPNLSDSRVIIIDAAEDIEHNAPNTLLKILEEPPPGNYFFLVSHASDRLLPTIRSRCQILRFDPLSSADMHACLQAAAPDAAIDEIRAIAKAGNGSPGQALNFMGLDMNTLETAIMSIIKTGDRSNELRTNLANLLSLKAAQPRYEAFLRRVPAVIADAARQTDLDVAVRATEAWRQASILSVRAVALSLDKQSVVFQMGSLLASLQPHKQAR